MLRPILSAFLVLLLLAAPAAGQQMLSGELVVLDAGSGRFRLVGHDGAFTAPGGTPLAALDGKAVTVELANGRVARISERPVAITPVTSGWETVRGQLELRDAAGGTFGVVGDRQSYSAPAGLDLQPYVGKWVQASIDADGRATAVTLLADRPPPAPPTLAPGAAAAPARGTCAVGDATVSSGSTVCRAGVTQRCDDGVWVSLGTACQ